MPTKQLLLCRLINGYPYHRPPCSAFKTQCWMFCNIFATESTRDDHWHSFPPGQGLCSVWEAVTHCTTRSRLQLLHNLQTHSAVHSLQYTAQTQTGNNEYYFLLHEASSLQHPQNKNMYISKPIMWPVELIPVGAWVYVKWLCLMLGASVWRECNEKGKAE